MTEINCLQIREIIDQYAENLDQVLLNQPEDFRSHIHTCAECRLYFEAAQTLAKELSDNQRYNADQNLINQVLQNTAHLAVQSNQVVSQQRTGRFLDARYIRVLKLLGKFIIALLAFLGLVQLLSSSGIERSARMFLGNFGILLYLITAGLMLITILKGRYKPAAGLASLALAVFILRNSQRSLDSYYKSARYAEVDQFQVSDFPAPQTVGNSQVTSNFADLEVDSPFLEEGKLQAGRSGSQPKLPQAPSARERQDYDRDGNARLEEAQKGWALGGGQPIVAAPKTADSVQNSEQLSRGLSVGSEGADKRSSDKKRILNDDFSNRQVLIAGELKEIRANKPINAPAESSSSAKEEEKVAEVQKSLEKNDQEATNLIIQNSKQYALDGSGFSRDLVGAKLNNELSAKDIGAVVKASKPQLLDQLQKAKKKEERFSIEAPQSLTAEAFARDFMAQRSKLDGLIFKPSTGYWSNTYVPGDSGLRRLGLDLKAQQQQRSAFGTVSLDRDSYRPAQPFDLPETAALAVYLNSDHKGINEQGQTRMLLQVGLQATQRHSGTRPAMNIGLVLDLSSPLNAETQARVEALLKTFAKEHQAGDRFSLTVAGAAGGTLIPASDFRFGTVSVALQNIKNSSVAVKGKLPTSSVDLHAALRLAQNSLSAADSNKNAVLGSNMLIIISPNSLENQVQSLTSFAHQSAVDGIPVSVFDLSGQPQSSGIDPIILAGQGNRRIVSSPSEAPDAVERELNALSRVVARAVRLKIKLAAGVKLVDILGSYRLDEVAAQKTRVAEQALDQKLSKQLGIESDRGKDEEGIQIIIPAFYASDAHTILLDVVASQPGQVAEVTARFKDLVFLNNGVSRAELSLSRSNQSPSALELSVLKNHLAFNLFQMLATAADDVAQNRNSLALNRLEYSAKLLSGIQQIIPALAQDKDIVRDLQMLQQYQAALNSSVLQQSSTKKFISDSMDFAARLKVVPRPELE